MKKTIKILFITFFTLAPFYAFASSVSPTTVTSGATIMTSSGATGGLVWSTWDSTDLLHGDFDFDDSMSGTSYDGLGGHPFSSGRTERFLLCDVSECGFDDYTSAKASGSYQGVEVIVTLQAPNQSMTFADIITNASTTFTGALGFNWQDGTNFMANMMNLVIGSGMALLVTLFPYIVGLVLIAGVVYFLFRAFVFFRH